MAAIDAAPSLRRARSGLFLWEFLLVVTGFFLVLEFTSDADPTVFLLYDGGVAGMALALVSVLTGFYFSDLYDLGEIRTPAALFGQLMLVLGISVLVQALLVYVFPARVLPRFQQLTGTLLALGILGCSRLLWMAWRRRRARPLRLALLGNSRSLRNLLAYWNQHAPGQVAIRAWATESEEPGPVPAGLADPDCRQAVLSEAGGLILDAPVDLVVVGIEDQRRGLPMAELLALRARGAPVEEAATLHESLLGRVPLWDLRLGDLVFGTTLGPEPKYLLLQQVYSAALALAGLAALSPVIAAIAALIKLTSPGPILFRQKRVGLHGRVFTFLKFRSMYVDADARTGPVRAKENDPRITPIGRWLRRWRLDELPQFWNVLRGEMALVGPRPELPEFEAVLHQRIPFYRQRLLVRPGITGWAQIHHVPEDEIEDTMRKLELDLYYVKHLSPALDAYVIFQTLKTVVASRGAR